MKKILFLFFLFCALTSVRAQNWAQFGNANDVLSLSYVFYYDTSTTTLYADGRFLSAIGDTINGIAKWNGSSWDSVGNGGAFDFSVQWIISYQGDLYAGGCCGAENIMRFDGTNWVSVGGGTDDAPETATIYNGELYIAGTFYMAGGVPTGAIAKWNGTQWSSVPPPSPWTLVHVRAIHTYNNELYVGGLWDGPWGRCLIRFNGTEWDSVGNQLAPYLSMMDGGVYDFAVLNNELYAGGYF